MEKKKSRIPSVRALDVLRSQYEKEIEKKTDAEHEGKLKASIKETTIKEAKSTLETLRNVLSTSAFKENKNQCNWPRTTIENDGKKITLVLEFDPTKNNTVKKAMEQIATIEKRRNSEKERLNDWYETSLLKITNRENDIKPFIVEE